MGKFVYPEYTAGDNTATARNVSDFHGDQGSAASNHRDADGAMESGSRGISNDSSSCPTRLIGDGTTEERNAQLELTSGVLEAGWTGDVKEFVLNGFYRETKVFFNSQQMEFGSLTYMRFKLHFAKGKLKQEERYDLDSFDQARVQQWWKRHGVRTLHKKMMEKKSNAMADLKRHMKGKSDYICNKKGNMPTDL